MDTTTTLAPTTTDTTFKPFVKLDLRDAVNRRQTLGYYNHPGWNPATDLSLLDLTQAEAGLNAIGRFVAGDVHGNAKLLIVAPTEKLGYINGTGAFAYVRSDYVPGKDDFSVNVDGINVFLTVRPDDIPNEFGYRRLYLDAGQLYSKKSWELVYTHDSPGQLYWICRTYSAILEGYNVSCSIGARLLDDAKAVEVVVNSDNPKEANEARRWLGRESSRFNLSVKDEITKVVANAVESGGLSIGASDLEVALAGGGKINLGRFNKTSPIRLMTEGGIIMRPQYLKDDTDVSRLALANKMRAQHLSIVLAQ